MIWAELLGIDGIGIRDDFFEIGGHSLLATQILSRIRITFGIELPLQVLFEDDFTIQRVAGLIDARQIAGASAAEIEGLMEEVGKLSDQEVAARLASAPNISHPAPKSGDEA